MRGIASNRLHTRLFFMLIFSLSWGFWILAALSSTKGETFPTRLFHFMVNLIGELFGLTLRAKAIYILLWIIVATGITMLWGPERLSFDGSRKVK